MNIIQFFKSGLTPIIIAGVLMVLVGCDHNPERVDNQVVAAFDTSDVNNTYQILSKNTKPIADSLYRSLFLSLSKQGKYTLIEQHLPQYRKIDAGSHMNAAISDLYTGLFFSQKSRCDSALFFTDRALIYIAADIYPQEYLMALRTKATCYIVKGEYDHAIGLRYQTIRLCEKSQDTTGKYQELGELGIAFYMANNHKKAAILIDSSLHFFKAAKNESLEAYFLSTKSVILFSNNHFDSAIVAAKTSLELRIKNGELDGQAESYNNLALAYMGKGDWEIAKVYLEQSMGIYQQIKNERQIPIILQNMATCYDRLNMSDSALAKIQESYLLAHQKGQLEEEKVALRMLTQFYKKKEDYKKSFEYYRLFNKLKDSIYSLEKEKTIEELSMKYETTQKEEQIKILQKDKQIQMQNKWMFAGFLIASILVGGVLMLLLMFRNRKNKELFISKEKLRQTELNQIKIELDFNKKELERFMLNFIEKTKLISALEGKLETFSETSELRNPHLDKNISELTQMKILTEENWAQFKMHFEKAYPGLIQHIKETFENLSPAELRMFLLMKLNIDSKEIASILGISIESVKKTRYRLKKKIELNEDVDLLDFIRKY
jgi:DNA-binding CsgD family transcriptional regulator/tetratricopeptide (TPR) repeat protein